VLFTSVYNVFALLGRKARRVPSFLLSGFIFDINKVEQQDGTQHEKKKLENYVDSPAYSRIGRYAPESPFHSLTINQSKGNSMIGKYTCDVCSW